MDRLGGNFTSHDDGADEFDYAEDTAGGETPPSPVGQDERRMQVRAYNHWASLLQDRSFPSIEDLDPDSLEDFGPYSVLLDFTAGIEDASVHYLGKKLAVECGDDDVIEKLSDVPSRSLLSRITDHYMQILANQAPIGFEAEFVNQRNINVLYRGILLPYSSDNETIDFIYGVINWKEMADQQTADELLLEIDQALGGGKDKEIASNDDDHDAEATWGEGHADVLDLGAVGEVTDEPASLPSPAFGATEPVAAPVSEPEYLGDELEWDDSGFAAANAFDEDEEVDYSVDYGDQGLEDGEIDEDVEDVVDPLDDDEAEASLVSLVSRGGKPKPTVELPSALGLFEPEAPPAPSSGEPPVPQPYEAEQPVLDFVRASILAPTEEAVPVDEPLADQSAFGTEPEPVEGLHDTLAAARELAQLADSSEDRTRAALYAAVGRAYDFSIEAQESPEQFAELVADNGLSVQERAPMTPVVKLVFGTEYDKTRLTEYAAVLSHAHRNSVERGSLADFLKGAEGGLKGVVKQERRLRREEAGKPALSDDGIKAALVRKLRAIDPVDFADIDTDGPEFALVMVRRTPEGEVVVLGEVPDDVKLVERAGNKLAA